MLKKFAVIFGLLSAATLFGASKNLEMYWIDAEGGAATLIVAPSGESLLVDTANRTPTIATPSEFTRPPSRLVLRRSIFYLLPTIMATTSERWRPWRK